MKLATNFIFAGVFAVAISGTAQAVTIPLTTVGTINGNSRLILEATGNSNDVGTFSTLIASAFVDNTGGVLNFDTAFTLTNTDVLHLSYGVGGTKTLNLTYTSGGNSGAGGGPAGEATSGSSLYGLNTPGGSPRTLPPIRLC